jgi:hypothetical protein
LEHFIGLLSKHLETFRELERLQGTALEAVKSQAMDGLADLLNRQGEVMASIGQEKSELRPLLDKWESLKPEVRQKLREGRAGNILTALETVAHAIQAKHQEMFGEEVAGAAASGSTSEAGSGSDGSSAAQDLSQTINKYRALQ